jgi:FkbM family methyltransferase
MEIKKILFLPRALADLASVLLKWRVPFSNRWMICRFLFHLKWEKWRGSETEVMDRLPGGENFYLPATEDSQFLLKEIWIEEVYKPIFPFSAEPKILDLGGNVGMALRYIGNQCGLQPGSVAVEADPDNMIRLRKNCSGRNVDLINAVVSDFTGKGRVAVSEAGFLNRRFEPSDEGQEFDFISILDLLKQDFDLVKMDIEGGEWKLFALLLRHPDYLLRSGYWMIEFHEEEHHQGLLQELDNFFERNGYKKKRIHSVRHYFREEAFGSNK